MTPTPKQAKAEIARRKQNKIRKANGEDTVKAESVELVNASGADLKTWAKRK